MDQARVLELIRRRQPQHTLPRELYTDEAAYRQDLAQLWHREWVFVGHTFELEKPGQYLALTIGDYPIVVVRGNDGEVRAFHNVCRHRGSKVCTQASGKVAKLVCPYHRWTYDLDGKLLFAGNMGEGFTPGDYPLQQAHCALLDSYIYVCVAETAPDFATFRRAAEPFLAPHRLANCKVAHESSIIERGNWKLVFENNRECFHCEGAHPELLNSFVENLAVAGVAGAQDPELEAFWDRCEAAGLPSRLAMDEAGQYRMTRIPLAKQALSYTMDGRPAVSRRLDAGDEANIGALLYFHYPSTWNHFLGDHALSFRLLPLGPSQTMVTTKWLVHRDAEEGVDYDMEHLTRVWKATNAQDRQLVEDTHAGVASPTYVAGPYSTAAEQGVIHFVDWYCAMMEARLSS
ncbi:aromatic ring-hydroxylating oxygenase subunit alpha [Halomonas sp. V046]|uniref:aromatic ring-hydroxylating oxygenase subunit alpha n=1 Tax=Halomonas sp. V046 TaxID=3459611 RepID=UPI004044594C